MPQRVPYYLNTHGKLVRKQNTVYFIHKKDDGTVEKRILPVKKIYAIYAFARISFSSGVVSFLAKEKVPIHFFNSHGYYEASLMPREHLVSGSILIKQAEHYLNSEKRVYLARKFVEGSANNMLKNLEYYERTKGELESIMQEIREFLKELSNKVEISEIMGIEANIRNRYYEAFDRILPEKFRFEKRTRRPPKNMVNALISFANSLVYSTVLSEIYNTQLNASISYLHEPAERRFSLALDIAEIFKPLLADRVIFKLLNKQILDESCFRRELNYCMLNEYGRREFLKAFNEKLETTIKHRKLGRKVSYRHLIRLECYKLEKHLLGMQKYEPFVIWW